MMKQDLIVNSKGEEVPVSEYLTRNELQLATRLQRKFDAEVRNAVGYDINITTLTAISKKVVEQKFFELDVTEYMPVAVGNGAWSDQIVTYQDFQLSGDFETGLINTGANNSRLAESDSGVAPVYNPVKNWAKTATWSFFDMQLAARSGNWDVVTSKEKSRKRNWDLGLQKIAFLGLNNSTTVLGLLTQPNVTTNTSLITQYISTMNATSFAALVQGLIGAYRVNSSYTAMPTHFIIPEGDFNGLGALVPGSAGTFPVPMMDYLLSVFRMITGNPNFKILRCAYADETNQYNIAAGLSKNIYTLLNYDEESLRMDIPVPYANTLQNTINGFQFQNAGYGQFTGLLTYRPPEMLYFTFT